ncbi:hypothetical protein BDZ89DRAFT_1140340 [Hymenopellis radicata]|nr:hypothetical protein BDZ89DRAFT_1140340 [Hymenopellis radicata]
MALANRNKELRYRLTEESLPAEYQVRITVKDATQVALDPDKVLALARDQENPGKLLDRVRELLRSRQDFPQSDYVSALHWLDDIFAEAVIELLKEVTASRSEKATPKTSPRKRKDRSTEDASKPAKRPREETPSPEELRTSTPSPQTRRKTSQPSGSQAETPAKQRAKENPGNPQKKKKTENPTTAEPERRMVTRSIAIEQGTSNKPQKQTPVVQIQTRKTVATTRQTVRGSPYRGKLVELWFSPLQPGKPAVLTRVRPQGPLRTDPNESPVRKDARRRWEAWGQEVVDEEGFKSRKARGTPGTKTPHPPPPSSRYPQLKRPQDALHPIPIEEDLFPEPFEGRGLFSRTRSFRKTPSPLAAGPSNWGERPTEQRDWFGRPPEGLHKDLAFEFDLEWASLIADNHECLLLLSESETDTPYFLIRVRSRLEQHPFDEEQYATALHWLDDVFAEVADLLQPERDRGDGAMEDMEPGFAQYAPASPPAPPEPMSETTSRPKRKRRSEPTTASRTVHLGWDGKSEELQEPAAGSSKRKAKREASPQELEEEETRANTPDESPAVEEESQSEGPVSRTHTPAPPPKEERRSVRQDLPPVLPGPLRNAKENDRESRFSCGLVLETAIHKPREAKAKAHLRGFNPIPLSSRATAANSGRKDRAIGAEGGTNGGDDSRTGEGNPTTPATEPRRKIPKPPERLPIPARTPPREPSPVVNEPETEGVLQEETATTPVQIEEQGGGEMPRALSEAPRASPGVLPVSACAPSISGRAPWISWCAPRFSYPSIQAPEPPPVEEQVATEPPPVVEQVALEPEVDTSTQEGLDG